MPALGYRGGFLFSSCMHDPNQYRHHASYVAGYLQLVGPSNSREIYSSVEFPRLYLSSVGPAAAAAVAFRWHKKAFDESEVSVRLWDIGITDVHCETYWQGDTQ